MANLESDNGERRDKPIIYMYIFFYIKSFPRTSRAFYLLPVNFPKMSKRNRVPIFMSQNRPRSASTSVPFVKLARDPRDEAMTARDMSSSPFFRRLRG